MIKYRLVLMTWSRSLDQQGSKEFHLLIITCLKLSKT